MPKWPAELKGYCFKVLSVIILQITNFSWQIFYPFRIFQFKLIFILARS